MYLCDEFQTLNKGCDIVFRKVVIGSILTINIIFLFY